MDPLRSPSKSGLGPHLRRGSSNSSLKQLKQLSNTVIPVLLELEVRCEDQFSTKQVEIFIEFNLASDTREEVVKDIMKEFGINDNAFGNELLHEFKKILNEKEILNWNQL